MRKSQRLARLLASILIGTFPLTSFGIVHADTPTTPSLTVSSATIHEFPAASGSAPFGITAGPDGNLWFTENTSHGSTNKIGEAIPGANNGGISEEDIPTPSAGARGITTGPDGKIWFVEGNSNKIASDDRNGNITEYTVSDANYLRNITAGPDGNLWFTNTYANKVGKITTTGTITEYPAGLDVDPWQIVTGSDGNLWFSNWDTNTINKVTTDGTVTSYPVPDGWFTRAITLGPDGNVWFTTLDGSGDYYGYVTPSGVVTEYKLNANYTIFQNGLGNAAAGITNGPDGNVWMTLYDTGGNAFIGKVNPTNGEVTAYPVPTSDSQPFGITSGSDGNIWFAEYNNSAIGELVLNSDETPFISNTTSSVSGKNVRLTVSGSLYTANFNIVSGSSEAKADNGYSYPDGLTNFTLRTVPGATATVTLYYTGLAYSSNMVLRKYDPVTQTYSTVSGARFSSITVDGQPSTQVTYQITDGSSLDQDGTVNGVIIDPVGPALVPTASAPNTGFGSVNNTLKMAFGLSLIVLSVGLALLSRQRNAGYKKVF